MPVKTIATLALAGVFVGPAHAAPKSAKVTTSGPTEVYRSDAVEELENGAPPPAPKNSRKAPATPKLSADELVMKFDDPNPPSQTARSLYLGLSLGMLRTRGTVESSTGEVFNLGDNRATNSFTLSFGGSRARRADTMQATEVGFVGETSPWRIGVEGKFQFARQSINRAGFLPEGTALQSTLAALQPWVSRRWSVNEKVSTLLGAELGYFQYSQLSSLTSYRFTRTTPVLGMELALLYDISPSWAAKAQFNARTKVSGDALELPENAWALGGRFQW